MQLHSLDERTGIAHQRFSLTTPAENGRHEAGLQKECRAEVASVNAAEPAKVSKSARARGSANTHDAKGQRIQEGDGN